VFGVAGGWGKQLVRFQASTSGIQLQDPVRSFIAGVPLDLDRESNPGRRGTTAIELSLTLVEIAAVGAVDFLGAVGPPPGRRLPAPSRAAS
jgi:hypothetical protein